MSEIQRSYYKTVRQNITVHLETSENCWRNIKLKFEFKKEAIGLKINWR